MKKLSIIIAGLAVMLGASIGTANAQQIAEPAVKILPTSEKGILKIMYAYSTDQPVIVKFFNEDGLVASDKVKGEAFPNGFSKKYDVRNLSSVFWVEVSTANMSVTFKMIESRDGRFTSLLEKSTFNYPLVAANN